MLELTLSPSGNIILHCVTNHGLAEVFQKLSSIRNSTIIEILFCSFVNSCNFILTTHEVVNNRINSTVRVYQPVSHVWHINVFTGVLSIENFSETKQNKTKPIIGNFKTTCNWFVCRYIDMNIRKDQHQKKKRKEILNLSVSSP